MVMQRRAMLSTIVGWGVVSLACGRFRHAPPRRPRTLAALLVEAIHGRIDKAEVAIVTRALGALEPSERASLERHAKHGDAISRWPEHTRRPLERIVTRYASTSAKFRKAIGAPSELPDRMVTCTGLGPRPS